MNGNDTRDEQLAQQLNSFGNLWKGGYYEGNPLDPMGHSGYGLLGYVSVLHVVYQMCIKPYISSQSVVLEIGPGRGAWTKTFKGAKEIWCLDALSAEHNQFHEYVGVDEKIRYIQVKDFACKELPDNYFNYFFSFGTLCHVSFEGVSEYLRNIFPKLVSGSQCFIMVADYTKYNNAMENFDRLNALRILETARSSNLIKKNARKAVACVLNKLMSSATKKNMRRFELQPSKDPQNGWYNAGVNRTCELISKIGYEVISPDIGAISRDPIIHFRKP